MAAAPLPDNERERLAALAALGIVGTPPSPELDIFPTLARSLLSTPMAAISLVGEHRQWFKARIGLNIAETNRDTSFCAHAILDPTETLYVPDATKDPRFADNPLVVGAFGIRFYAGVPIIGPSGHALGALCVIDREPRHLSKDALDQLRQLAIGVESVLKLHASDLAMRAAVKKEKDQSQLFTSIFMRINAPVAIVTSSGNIVISNPAFHHLVGCSTDELKSICVDDLTPPKHKPAMFTARAKQFHDGERFEMTVETFAKGSGEVPVHLTSALMRDNDQRLRVLTLIPIPQASDGSSKPPPSLPARDVGELRAVSLEAFRFLFGEDWERISARALMRAEKIIRRRLGEDDVVSRTDDDKFVIWFQSTDADKNEDTLKSIVRDIRLQFTTEFGKQAAENVSAAFVPGADTTPTSVATRSRQAPTMSEEPTISSSSASRTPTLMKARAH